MDFRVKLIELLRALNRRQVKYGLIGGVAMNFHGFVRATQDVDLVVKSDPETLQKMRSAFKAVWDDPDIDLITDDDLLGEYSVVRYGPPGETFFVDIITKLGEQISYEQLEFEPIDVDGETFAIASPRQLFQLKRNTLRPVDRLDAQRLAVAFGFGGDDD